MHFNEEIETLLNKIETTASEKEERLCNPAFATLSSKTAGRRMREEVLKGRHRTAFALDRDRILYSKAFFRLAGKTQVFMSPRNPLISNRMTHTLHVAQISRAIARALDLNEDLTEAIALGHDAGHPPFGHKGEKILDDLSRANGGEGFMHNVQSLRILDVIEKDGRGLNLTYEVKEGIIRHCGETDAGEMAPGRPGDHDNLIPDHDDVHPSTLEGCVVKLCDRIAYVGKDIEDATRSGIVREEEIPESITKALGKTNGQIIDTLVKDLIMNFHRDRDDFLKNNGREPTKNEISIRLSLPISQALNSLIKDFNYPNIYLSEQNMRFENQTEYVIKGVFTEILKEVNGLKIEAKSQASLVEFSGTTGPNGDDPLMRLTLGELETADADPMEKAAAKRGIIRRRLETFEGGQQSILHFLRHMNEDYRGNTSNVQMVVDYITLMTDEMAMRIYDVLTKPEPIV